MKITSEETRQSINIMIGYEAVKQGEEIIGYNSCMWCKKIMPIVSRSAGSFNKDVCAGCNATHN